MQGLIGSVLALCAALSFSTPLHAAEVEAKADAALAAPDASADGAAAAAGSDKPVAPLPPKHRLTYSNLLALRVNPLGFEDRITFGYEERLWKDPGILTRDAYVGLKLAPVLNPAMLRLGAQLEVKPAAILALRAGAFYKQWFGTFTQLDAFDSPNAEHCDQCMKDDDEAGRTVGATTGFESELGALAQAKVGPIAVRNDTALYYADADTPGKTVHYDSRLDMVVPDGGFSMTNDTDLLYVTEFGLAAGARLSVIHAFYRDTDYLVTDTIENQNTPAVRLGPAVAYTFFEEPGAKFDKPTLILLTQWWLEHRYRAGQDISQGLPLIALAFRFEGRLWGSEN